MPFVAEEVPVRDLSTTPIAGISQSAAVLKTPEELAKIVKRFASSDDWLDRVRLRTDERWYERLYHGPDYDVWAISWMPGQSTGFHDHGNSAGAFVVASGVLEEHRPGKEPFPVRPGILRAFGADYAHNVRNNSIGPAISIHAYSPPLTEMNEYELDGSELVPKGQVFRDSDTPGRGQEKRSAGPEARTGALSIEQVLFAARTRLQRLSPQEAFDEIERAGSILVDIRPESQRAVEGDVPGALIVERNVLEWRFDPASSSRLPVATDHNIRVIVLCSEGYTSSLAAVALQELGLWRTTDIVGGFSAWSEAGLPITSHTA